MGERSSTGVLLDQDPHVGGARSWLHSLLGRGSSVDIPGVWVGFPCSSGDTLPASPPSALARPPTRRGGGSDGSQHRAESSCSGPGQALRGAGILRLLPPGCDGCWVNAGASRDTRVGVSLSEAKRGGSADPLPWCWWWVLSPGVLPAHVDGACGAPQGRPLPVGWLWLWPHPAQNACPSHLPLWERGWNLLSVPRKEGWGGEQVK